MEKDDSHSESLPELNRFKFLINKNTLYPIASEVMEKHKWHSRKFDKEFIFKRSK
jgi:hypothetical protein